MIIEKTYAQSIFEIAEENKNIKEVLEELKALNEIFKQNLDFIKLLDTPTVSLNKKLEMIEEIFKDKCSEFVFNFLCVLVERRRFRLFPKMYSEYLALYNDYYNIALVSVTTSIPLDDESRGKIISKLEKVTKKNVSLTEIVDESLIGGIVVNYGNTRLDGSVRTKLSGMKEQIKDIII